ncbi:ATP-binding protein [Nonomuraea purpurea]|uniref:ATP-binding protein n=1 Tax=Nonomuraea purpurea TaxID=1849276 RepID=A0ABV8GAP1_9ACTN
MLKSFNASLCVSKWWRNAICVRAVPLVGYCANSNGCRNPADLGGNTVSGRFLAVVVMPGVNSSVPLLRQYVTLVLTAAGHQDLEAVRLVLTELSANAVLHTRSGDPGGLVTVEVSEISDRLARIEVSDDGAQTVPRLRQTGDGEDHGRGLQLVEALSVRWGVKRSFPGNTVWAEILTTEGAPPAAALMVSVDVVAA